MVLGDAEDTEGGLQLEGATAARPPLRCVGLGVRGLAEGSGHADRAAAGVAQGREQPAGEVGLVVRVRPDRENGAQRGGVDGGGASHASCRAVCPIRLSRACHG